MKIISSRTWGRPHVAAWMAALGLGLGPGHVAARGVGGAERERSEPQVAASEVAEPASSERLRVEVDPALDDASRLPGWIAERSAGSVEGLEAKAGRGAWVRVEVGGETYEYRVTVTPMRGDSVVGEAVEPIVCSCTSKELLERVDEEVRRVVEAFEPEPPREPVAEGDPEPSPVTTELPATRRRLPPLTWVGKTGVALVVVGGAGAIAGAVMVGVNRGKPLSDGYGYLARDFRNPTGFVLLGVGGALLVGGVVPLVLDLTRCRRKPEAPGCGGSARAGARWSPWVAAGEAGVSVTGRF